MEIIQVDQVINEELSQTQVLYQIILLSKYERGHLNFYLKITDL